MSLVPLMTANVTLTGVTLFVKKTLFPVSKTRGLNYL